MYVIAISGSLRKAAYSTAILRALADLAADRMSMRVVTLGDVPLYDGDVDTAAAPAAIAALRANVAGAAGVVIASPEYNYAMSGVLKNALDWISRPYGRSGLIGKPVLTLTSSPATTGGVRAQAGLNEVLLAMGAQLLAHPQTVIGSVHEKLRDGRIVDNPTRDFLVAGIDALLVSINRNAPTFRREA